MRSAAVFTVLKSSRLWLARFALGAAVAGSWQTILAFESPNWKITPGAVCTPSDPDFKGYDYPEGIARCKRSVSINLKLEIAKNYGDIPRAEWSNYEFDHLLPLCAGGSNSFENIWPQPLEEAKKKDVVEQEVCAGLRDGTMTQKVALQKIRDWFDNMVRQGDAQSQKPLPERQQGENDD